MGITNHKWGTIGGNGDLARGPGGFNPTRFGSAVLEPFLPLLEHVYPKDKIVHCTAYAVSPIFGSGCLQPLASKLISLAIVFSSCFIKVPVFKNVASIWNKNNKASKGKKPLSMGLSTLSIYTELLMFTNATLYGLLSAYPLLAFGETLTQAIQTIVLIAVVAMATGTVGRTIPKLAIFGGYVFAVYTMLPAEHHQWLIRGNIVFVTVARGSQILKNFSGEKGAQSALTTFLQAFGTAVRIFTTVQEVGWDMNLLAAYGVGFVLNSCLLVQVVTSGSGASTSKITSKSESASRSGSGRQTSQSRADLRSRNKANNTRESRQNADSPVRRNTPRKTRGTPLKA